MTDISIFLLCMSLAVRIETVCFTVVNQFYEAEILTEYVIRGNTAVLKCSIPSFVADFVQVEAWIAEDGETHVPSSENYGMLKHHYHKILLLPYFVLFTFLTLCFQW